MEVVIQIVIRNRRSKRLRPRMFQARNFFGGLGVIEGRYRRGGCGSTGEFVDYGPSVTVSGNAQIS